MLSFFWGVASFILGFVGPFGVRREMDSELFGFWDSISPIWGIRGHSSLFGVWR